MSVRRSASVRFCRVALCVMVLGLVQGCLEVTITSPVNGVFTTASSVVVNGTMDTEGANDPLATYTVTVNGVAATIQPNKTWSATVPLDPAGVFNTIQATVTRTTNGNSTKAFTTVIVGDSVDENVLAPGTVGFRVNESALAGLDPVLSSLITFDLATLLPVGTVLINNQCFVDGGFLGCLGRGTVTVSNPAPKIDGFDFALDSQVNQVHVDADINGLEINVDLDGTGLVPSCGIEITATTTDIGSNLGLEPGATTAVDVFQNGNVTTSFGGFNHDFTSGVCDVPILGDIIGLFLPNVEALAESGIADFLNQPDGNGNTPFAAAFEEALLGLDITGPVGALLQADLEAPAFLIAEDNDGVTVGLDTKNVPTCTPPPGAANLTHSYSKIEPFPTFGTTTPVAGIPYGIGVCLSTTAFNQLLKTLTECGSLNLAITDFGGAPLTVQTLLPFFPELNNPFLTPATALRFDASAQLAPIITGEPGPAGELANVKLGDLRLKLVDVPQGITWLEISFNANLGVNFTFDPVQGALVFDISAPQSGDFEVYIRKNPLKTNEVVLALVLETIVPSFFPSIADALGALPIPEFAGLSISASEVSRNGEFLSLYGDVPVP